MKRILGAVVLACLYFTGQAQALPILRESAGQYESTFVTIYPDHRNPNLFYFLPNSMQFAKDSLTGIPNFSLSTYGIEQPDLSLANGYLSFVFRAAITKDVQTALDSFRNSHPGAILATMPVGESYMTVGTSRSGVPSGGAAKYFESWDLPPFGGVLESEVGGNGYLTGLGAKVMTNALKSGTPYELNYCFKVDGVTPMMDARVTVDYQKVFNHWRATAKVGWSIFGAEVVREVTSLVESGAIGIELHGDTKFEDLVFEMARQLARDYLKPSLANSVGSNGSTLADIPFRYINFGFNNQTVEERHTVTMNIRKQADLTDVRCLAAPFRDLAPYVDRIVQNTPRLWNR